MSEFTLNGGTKKIGKKWRAIVELKTPDGKVTTTESDVLYSTEKEAAAAAIQRTDEILSSEEFKGTEVLSKNGQKLS